MPFPRERADTSFCPNDPALYDRLVEQWERPHGSFAMLYWLAAARAALVPLASRPDAVLVDLGCGGGLMTPLVAGKGYRHVGVDVSPRTLCLARDGGLTAVRGDVLRVPLRDECADVVVAGEILEHVPDLPQAVAEACRLLRPGGLLVLDTLADTALCRLLAIHAAERLPKLLPRGVHDPRLLVNRDRLARACARHGVRLQIRGIRPALPDVLAWAVRRRQMVRMVPVPTTAVLFQGRGRKEHSRRARDRTEYGSPPEASGRVTT